MSSASSSSANCSPGCIALDAMVCSSVIIDNLDVRRARRSVRPLKADAPLIVNPDAVLALAIAFQRFEPVAGQRRQVLTDVGRFKAIELEPRRSLDAREHFHALARRKVSRSLIAVADDHPSILYTGLRVTSRVI